MRVKRALAVALLILIVGCMPVGAPTTLPTSPPASEPPGTQPASPIAAVGEIVEARSDAARNPIDAATSEQLTEMVAADRAFAFDLYRTLIAEENGNLFISPYSISTAMSMVLAGARGETAEELASTLGVGVDKSAWHPARNRLELELAALADYVPPGGGDAVPLTLERTNSIFGQAGYPFVPDFLDLLAANYGAAMNAVDFVRHPEPSRLAINAWVAERTRDRIEELLPQDSIDELTRAVLVNAIFFKANWVHQFDPELTETAPFRLLDGSTVDVSLMQGSMRLDYAAGDGWQAVQLPYIGGASMIVLVPDDGRYAEVEGRLDEELLAEVSGALAEHQVELGLPRWESASDLDLIPPFKSLGVELLFDWHSADLTGIANVPGENLFVTGVFHQANINVDEVGTEAAAATAAVVGLESLPPPATLTVDRPFIYLISDDANGEILFLGRLLEP
jgi:serpin B